MIVVVGVIVAVSVGEGVRVRVTVVGLFELMVGIGLGVVTAQALRIRAKKVKCRRSDERLGIVGHPRWNKHSTDSGTAVLVLAACIETKISFQQSAAMEKS